MIRAKNTYDILNKALATKKPSVKLNDLKQSGWLFMCIPELQNLEGVCVEKGVHHKDNFKHTLQVVDNVALVTTDNWLRWSALLHDIGKSAVKRFSQKNGWTFNNHEEVGSKMAKNIMTEIECPKDLIDYVCKLIKLHGRPKALVDEEVTDSAIRRIIKEAGAIKWDLMTLCECDLTTANLEKKKKYLSGYIKVRIKMSNVVVLDNAAKWRSPVSGEEIMKMFNLPQGREVGLLKDMMIKAIKSKDIKDDYTEAFNYLVRIGLELGYIMKEC